MQLLVRYQKHIHLVGRLNDELAKVKLTFGELGTGRVSDLVEMGKSCSL